MGEGGFRSVIESLIHFSIVWCNGKKFPLVTSKTCPQFIFFPKLNTTVKIHRAQRIHICSTRYTLYKLDMYNSTECLNPPGSPPTKKCFDERDGESERGAGGAVSVLLAMFSSALRSSYRHSEDQRIKARVGYDYPADFFLDSFHCQLGCTSFVFTQSPSPLIKEMGLDLFLLDLTIWLMQMKLCSASHSVLPIFPSLSYENFRQMCILVH